MNNVILQRPNTPSFKGMPIGLPLLQSHPKTLSKLICSPAHKDNFTGTPSNFAKHIFIHTAS
jgi:hypothetical protein